MRRDYALFCKTSQVPHIEARYRWGRRACNVGTLLSFCIGERRLT
jgi:hypothetical protein